MNAGRYTIKTFLTDHNLQQILIPEIQRDYVWNTDNVDKLLASIKEDFEKEVPKQNIPQEMWDMMTTEFREQFVRNLEKQRTYTNVGFLYAYHDKEIPDRYMLIDGQQRMTTMFLILLALYIRDGKAEQFKRLYFSNGLVKLDYRVRENSHNFLYDFFRFLLEGGKIEEAEDQYWYYEGYKHDKTVQSLYINFKHICSMLSKFSLSIDYVENQIEFWYFDTNKSAQGEELYLYMNSRGESVQSNENIKANLLEHIPEGEKNEWGEKWEEWQQIFWINRQEDNPNADMGFDEFLKWIKIMENLKSGNNEKASNQTEYVKIIKESNTLSTVGLDLVVIEGYVLTLKRILELNLKEYFGVSDLNGDLSALNYVLVLPLITFVNAKPDIERIEIVRFAQFFLNVSRFEIISKNPYMHVVQALGITRYMLSEGQKDIAMIRHLPDDRYENILTPEERMKLSLFADIGVFDRTEIENSFWKAESLHICEGRIKIIWDTMGFDLEDGDATRFDFERFKIYRASIEKLFEEPTDLLRRALLTKGDYAINNGYTNSLEGARFSFGFNNWKAIFEEEAPLAILKDLMDDYVNRASNGSNLSCEDILNEIISNYLASEANKDWQYHFVKQPEIMSYCRQKMVCFSGDNLSEIYLLQDKKAATHNYRELKSFIAN